MFGRYRPTLIVGLSVTLSKSCRAIRGIISCDDMEFIIRWFKYATTDVSVLRLDLCQEMVRRLRL
jgi:hypothetical protein